LSDIDAALLQAFGQFLDSLVVGDVDELFIITEAVLNEWDQRRHLLGGIPFIKQAQVIAVLKTQDLLRQVGLHDRLKNATVRARRAFKAYNVFGISQRAGNHQKR
jgi:hypothetical protein